jgi:hypothetical protein
MPRVYEVMPFFRELDLLELHLMEMDSVVDAWGICELPVTFTGVEKPLVLKQALIDGRFERWRGRIRLIHPASYPQGQHPIVDWFQRRQLARGFMDAEPDDLIILSDLDEIPNRKRIEELIAHPKDHPVVMVQDLYYYSVTWKDPGKWCGTIVAPRKCLGEHPDLQELRDMRGMLPQVLDGGWHFSWLGSTEDILTKMQAVDVVRENAIYGSDGIEPPPQRREYVEECKEYGTDLFGRVNRPKQKVPILPGTTHPHEIMEWLMKHPVYA